MRTVGLVDSVRGDVVGPLRVVAGRVAATEKALAAGPARQRDGRAAHHPAWVGRIIELLDVEGVRVEPLI